MPTVVSFSGGKDSTAMLIKLVEAKENIHSILFFDTERDFNAVKNHIKKIKKDFDIPFITVRHWVGFDFLIKRYGEASPSGGWCAACKRDVCNNYMRLIKKDFPNVVEAIGFTTDEIKRAERKIKDKKWELKFPLIEQQMSEEDCLSFCYEHGYDFDGIYEKLPTKRLGCYDCPKMSRENKEYLNACNEIL